MFHPGFDLEMTYAKHQKHKLDMEKIYHYNGLNQLVSVIENGVRVPGTAYVTIDDRFCICL
jgi:hypothetical protein